MNIAFALTHLFPGIDLLSEVTIGDDKGVQSILRWNRPEPRPTEVELAEAFAEASAEAQAMADLRDGLRAAWSAIFTEGERAFLQPIYDAALVAFDGGDVAKAQEIIATAPSITPTLDAKRDQILELFP